MLSSFLILTFSESKQYSFRPSGPSAHSLNQQQAKQFSTSTKLNKTVSINTAPATKNSQGLASAFTLAVLIIIIYYHDHHHHYISG